jgi:predicted TIM-barrel fold metal-dependent hydrolase
LSDCVGRNAGASPDKPAYVDHSPDSPDYRLTWSEFDRAAANLASELAELGVGPSDRVALWHKDSAPIHVALVAVERCGAAVVGLGARIGIREAAHILRTTRPTLLVNDIQRRTLAEHAAARYPDLKICLSEGGIGWLAGLLDRLDHMLSYHEMYGTWRDLGERLTPSEVLKRNFWFCAVEDQSSFVQHERIGDDNILLEADYPHCDSAWPHTQATIHEQISGLPDAIIRKVTWENASRLYQHPVPATVQADHDAF